MPTIKLSSEQLFYYWVDDDLELLEDVLTYAEEALNNDTHRTKTEINSILDKINELRESMN